MTCAFFPFHSGCDGWWGRKVGPMRMSQYSFSKRKSLSNFLALVQNSSELLWGSHPHPAELGRPVTPRDPRRQKPQSQLGVMGWGWGLCCHCLQGRESLLSDGEVLQLWAGKHVPPPRQSSCDKILQKQMNAMNKTYRRPAETDLKEQTFQALSAGTSCLQTMC